MHNFSCRCTRFGQSVLQTGQAIDEFQIAVRNLRVSTSEGKRAKWASTTKSFRRTKFAFFLRKGRLIGAPLLFWQLKADLGASWQSGQRYCGCPDRRVPWTVQSSPHRPVERREGMGLGP